jgi:phosphoribosylformylglycinamidine synthase
MAAACRALGVPVVSGNVSLYNETNEVPVLPTPMIGVVGVLEDVRRHATLRWNDGDAVLLLGGSTPSLGGTAYLATCHDRVRGTVPALDLDLERRVQAVVRNLIAGGTCRAAHDCSDGGVAVALAEMAIVSGLGCIGGGLPAGVNLRADEILFGEAGSRVLIAVPDSATEIVLKLCRENEVVVTRVGTVGGDRLAIDRSIDLSVADLVVAYESALTSAAEVG